MNRTIRLLLGAAMLGALVLPASSGARADIGPRRPISRVEVKDPENYLTMRDETVSVTIDPSRMAHVEARFHFALVSPAWRQTLAMRLGFPQLTADAPLSDFKVRQIITPPGVRPERLEPVSDITPQPPAADGSLPPRASWLTWPLVFAGHEGPPQPEDVHAVVTYTQKLTPQRDKTWRYTYVLRSGAPWKAPIGAAQVTVTVKSGKIVSALPKGATIKGGTVTWSLKNIEPAQDVVVIVR